MPDSPRAATETAARVRARYAKTGKLRFVSAIDLGRVWERSLRRADLPIAYSEGFSPHPKVSFPDALPLGYASTGEYVELIFAGPVEVAPAMAALNAAFPAGARILDAVPVEEGAPKLSKWLRASLWHLQYPAAVDPTVLARAVDAARAADALPVDRERKGDVIRVDLRPALHDISSDGHQVAAVLHHVEPPVRPTEVHLALAAALGAPVVDLEDPALVTRVAQGAPAPGGLTEALSGTLLPTVSGSQRPAPVGAGST
jgi:radical SAM-linked protein